MNRLRPAVLSLAFLAVFACGAAAQDDIPTDTPDMPDAPAAAAEPQTATPTPAPGAEPPVPVYEEKLLRLSEILGSLAFLRDLCGEADGASWRSDMNALLDAEKPAPVRRTRLVARFNHGFETFNAVYRTCTPSARLSISRYLSEGEALASDVRGRYSQ